MTKKAVELCSRRISRIMRMAAILAVLLSGLTTFAQQPTISGMLWEGRRPVPGAMVILQSLTDNACVKLFLKKKPKKGDDEKLRACLRDVKTAYSDERGDFSFGSFAAGWYEVRILWAVKQEPRISPVNKGDFVLIYSRKKDTTGKYDGFAQGKPFYHSATSETRLDFDLDFE